MISAASGGILIKEQIELTKNLCPANIHRIPTMWKAQEVQVIKHYLQEFYNLHMMIKPTKEKEIKALSELL